MTNCTYPNCPNAHHAKGYCKSHYARILKYGDVHTVLKRGGGSRGGSITDKGYRIIHRPGHPLARPDGRVREHRAVLFDAIGDGPHPCHHCGKVLPNWDVITVDHLNWDRLDNTLSNLVPSCLPCNGNRTRPLETVTN